MLNKSLEFSAKMKWDGIVVLTTGYLREGKHTAYNGYCAFTENSGKKVGELDKTPYWGNKENILTDLWYNDEIGTSLFAINGVDKGVVSVTNVDTGVSLLNGDSFYLSNSPISMLEGSTSRLTFTPPPTGYL